VTGSFRGARLHELARPFEINFGSEALSKIARQYQGNSTVRFQLALRGYRTALTSLPRKAVAFLGFTRTGMHREKQNRRPKITISERPSIAADDGRAPIAFCESKFDATERPLNR
jgi:hypothetical protein